MAKKITAEELKNLPPERRIALLKKFEEKRKKEIEKAESLIQGSEKELEKEKETKREIEEESRKLLEEEVAEGEGEELEGIVEKARENSEEAGAAQVAYGAPLEELKKVYEIATTDVYDRIKDLRNRASEAGLSEEEKQRVNFYQNQFSQVSNVQAAYINDEKKRISIMKAKTALEQIKEYETMM